MMDNINDKYKFRPLKKILQLNSKVRIKRNY